MAKKPAKILIVDDERHVVRLIEANLRREGYVPIGAFSIKEAVDKLQSEQPDMMIIEIAMEASPGHRRDKGFELLRSIKAGKVEGVSRELPVMVLSRLSADADVFAAWQAGVDYYSTKPFNPKEVVSRCETLLKPRADEIAEEDENLEIE